MQPFYFGPPGRRLFGIYHPAPPQGFRNAVLMCQPLGHEYVRTHRAFRNLATLLARQGCAVLRFDYYGCGDSGGEAGDVTLERCAADIGAAIAELKQRSGASRVWLVGLRLGGALALLTAIARRDVEHVLLWDPVINGKDYLEKQRNLHQQWANLDGRVPGVEANRASESLLGFEMADGLCRELTAIDLGSMVAKPPPPLRISLVPSVEAEPAQWEHPAFVHTALLPSRTLQRLAAAIQPPPTR